MLLSLTLRRLVSLAILPAVWFTLALPRRAQADDNPTPASLELGLQGAWRGALEYRDYQSDRRQQLPVGTRFEVAADGATLIRRSVFDDGPVTGHVHITAVALYDATGTRCTTAFFRKGRPVDLATEEVQVTAWRGPEQWTLVHRQSALDGGQPSEIRITQTRDGAVLTTLKEVRPTGAPDSAWAFRNQTRLTRQ